MARHIQEKLKSLIHEVQHAIQVKEGFAVGESPANENRNQSTGEIEADDVKARQSMNKEERLNTFPESMKPNQNADVVFWENVKCTNKTKFSLKDNSDNENSNIDEKDVAAIQSIGQLNLKERGIINQYTYNKLAQKADMPVTKLAEDLPINSDGKINRADILAKTMNNVRDKNNSHNTENTSFIYVKDIDKNIFVGKYALRYGLMRNSKDTAKVTTKIGDVLENAIKVNGLKPRNNTLGGYVLMGIGIDDKGNYYPTRIIVNNYEVQKIEPLDVVYAVRTKKKNQSPNGAGFASKETPLSKGSSEISVSDFLDIVKENFADTLPRDVLEKYNTKRPKSALSESVKYSIKESDYDKIANRLMGDDLLNAYDTIEEIRNVGGKVDENGYAYVYHNTSKDNAENIRKTGVMSAKEDSIFVSTKPDGQSEFDISSDISYNDIKGKSFLLIYDNSTTGRTFKGLEGFIEDNGGKVVGYYAMTTGQDMSEKMITTDETWEKLKQFGIEKIRNFAESEGIRSEISRNGLTERETRELIRQYRKKADKRRIDGFMSKNEGTQKEIQRVYENGRRDSEKDRTQGKFSLKSLNSSNLDTVENNTDNVQIKSDNFKNWFGDWENNPSKASKVVNEDGTPKVVYHGTDKGGFYVFDPKMSDDKISLFFFLIAK